MTEKPAITSRGFTIEKLFEGHKYKLASYQREYTWTRAEVHALISDLHGRFYPQWRRLQHDDADVETYEPYYLGSIVYYEDDTFRHLVDGQQRITTLHLLLIFLRRLLDDVGTLPDLAAKVRNLIWSRPGRAFTVQIEERTEALKALMRNERPVVPSDASDSVRNLVRRYTEIDEGFPYALRDEALELFVEWLLYRVFVVGIEAADKTRGWEIFETTNDRGIRLGPMDLLKSHLIGQVAAYRQREMSERWRVRMSTLAGYDLKVPSEFVRDLIVAKYLKDLGEESRTDATTAVHEWIRTHTDELGLHKSIDFQNFVNDMILNLAEHYESLRRAIERYDPDHPWAAITYLNEHNGIPFHFAAVLASLRPQDEPAEFHEKAWLVGAYLDLLYVRRLVNRRAMRVDSLAPDVLNLILELRDCADVAAVREKLAAKAATLRETFAGVGRFALSPESRAQVRYLLARITAFAQVGVGRPDETPRYLDIGSHDVEHIVPNHFAQFHEENPGVDEKQFPLFRNRLGALLLLPKLQNSGIGDAPYPERIRYYRDQHLLAASLHPDTRTHNKLVKQFVRRHGLDQLLQPVPHSFGVEAIELRQALYRRLCELVWDAGRLGLVSAEQPDPAEVPLAQQPQPPQAPPGVRRPMVTTPNTDAVRRLVRDGVLVANEQIVGTVDDITYEATVLADGTVQLLGEVYPDITSAANFIREKSTRGWDFWKVRRNGNLVSLAKLRPSR
jgi:hypothetical protein